MPADTVHGRQRDRAGIGGALHCVRQADRYLLSGHARRPGSAVVQQICCGASSTTNSPDVKGARSSDAGIDSCRWRWLSVRVVAGPLRRVAVGGSRCLVHAGLFTHGIPGMSHVLLVVVVMVCLAMTYAEIRHPRVLCPRCAEAVPLDGARQAHDRAAVLRWTHGLCPGYSPWRYWVDIALTVVVGAVMVLPVPPLVAGFAGVVVFGTRPVDAYLTRAHDPLQPWCPQCHWDDDGDDEGDTDVPDPVPPSGAPTRL